ncbi:MAG: spore coat protein [Clostridiales bacterium]|nr:spore coat protein [Clostridiales bacterium]
MQEKDMVNDALAMFKSTMTEYSTAIAEAGNEEFRQAVQQMRNNDEKWQYDLFKIAQQKGYYKPAQAASPNDLQTVKSEASG